MYTYLRGNPGPLRPTEGLLVATSIHSFNILVWTWCAQFLSHMLPVRLAGSSMPECNTILAIDEIPIGTNIEAVLRDVTYNGHSHIHVQDLANKSVQHIGSILVTSTTDVAWLRCWRGSWDPRCVLGVGDLEELRWPSRRDKGIGRWIREESLGQKWQSNCVWRLWAYTMQLSWYASIITRRVALGFNLKLEGSE